MEDFSESDVLAVALEVSMLLKSKTDSLDASLNILNATRAAILGSSSHKSRSLPQEDACPSPVRS
jgi:hypothetical protein